MMDKEVIDYTTNFLQVAQWNDAAGVKPCKPEDRFKDRLTLDLILEEANEFEEAFEEEDIESVADAIGDLLVVVYGAAYRLGLNADAIFKEVFRSNCSKFLTNEEDAKKSVEQYRLKNRETYIDKKVYEDDNTIYIIKDKITNKILKGIHFSEPNFSALKETKDELKQVH